MRHMLEDKRIRQLVIALLVVVLVLGALSLVSTALQLLVPLAIVAAGAFAFYKIVLAGRDKSEVMEDEVAESSGVVLENSVGEDAREDIPQSDEDNETAARQRLSALEQAQSEFLDSTTLAEEILDQIKSRKQRLHWGRRRREIIVDQCLRSRKTVSYRRAELLFRQASTRRHVMRARLAGDVSRLAGDGQADLRGAWRAEPAPSTAIHFDNYPYWAAELAREDFHYGQFGENLTTAGFAGKRRSASATVLRIGEAVIQVSQPRAHRATSWRGQDGHPRLSRRPSCGRTAFRLLCARVLEEGYVEAGDPIHPDQKETRSA